MRWRGVGIRARGGVDVPELGKLGVTGVDIPEALSAKKRTLCR